MSLPDEARALLALPPDRFVAERDALARALADRGDLSAAQVRKLRRPMGLAWVLNRLARDAREDVEALLRAGDRLRAGHRRALAGGGPAELRAAEDELRERARALRGEAARILREAARNADAAVLSHLELLLRFVAPTPGPQREGFRTGVLTAEPTPEAADASGLTVVPGVGRPRPPRSGATGAAPSRAGRATARVAKREADRAAREARRAEALGTRRRAAAHREVVRADQTVKRAEAAAARAEKELTEAAERARELRAAADRAHEQARRRRQELERLGR